MGLDMYLYAERYISGWDYASEEERRDYSLAAEIAGVPAGIGVPAGSGALSATVQVNVAYWRKANAIHGWFVREVQDGNDDCNPYYVSRENLEDLRDLCASLLALCATNPEQAITLAKEKLPPMGGCFFGSVEIDDYFWSYVKDTAAMLEKVLQIPKDHHLVFYYRASW